MARKMSYFFAVSAAAILVSGLGLTQAAADTQELPSEFVTEVTTVWNAHGVSAATQESLLTKLKAGEPVEAMGTGAAPVFVGESEVEGTLEKVSTYSDGSIAVLTLERPAVPEWGGDRTRGVSGCSMSGAGRIHTNCKVSGWFTGVSLSFLADYKLGTVEDARINNYWAPTVGCVFPLTCTGPTLEVTRLAQMGSLAARVGVVAYWSGAGSGTTRLFLDVRDYSATTN
ncbi:hypothetical protein [Luethyella okanaganae]|uniref:Uncharacterized protein n=1 Tax=Luethyella okanaganae TaxID=69372 RepID=A0ABW1VBB6_9MICO